jgi:hypothetical protein
MSDGTSTSTLLQDIFDVLKHTPIPLSKTSPSHLRSSPTPLTIQDCSNGLLQDATSLLYVPMAQILAQALYKPGTIGAPDFAQPYAPLLLDNLIGINNTTTSLLISLGTVVSRLTSINNNITTTNSKLTQLNNTMSSVLSSLSAELPSTARIVDGVTHVNVSRYSVAEFLARGLASVTPAQIVDDGVQPPFLEYTVSYLASILSPPSASNSGNAFSASGTVLQNTIAFEGGDMWNQQNHYPSLSPGLLIRDADAKLTDMTINTDPWQLLQDPTHVHHNQPDELQVRFPVNAGAY